MSTYDHIYLDILGDVLDGTDTPDRTGVGCRKIFDVNYSIDIGKMRENITVNDEIDVFGFDHALAIPALSLRQTFPRTAWYELLWMLSGSTDTAFLEKKGVGIWFKHTSREALDKAGLTHIRQGHGGKIYGHQFRNFNGVDQLKMVDCSLRDNPNSRRHMISLWNPVDLNEMALPPCHLLYQFVVVGDTLNLKFYQRSADVILGVPMNIMFSAFFLQLMADRHGFKTGKVAHSIGDCHLYSNHVKAAVELLKRPIIDSDAFVEPMMYGRSGDDIDAVIKMLSAPNHIEVFRNMRYEHNDPLPREMLEMAV